jgi:hypothetical protein
MGRKLAICILMAMLTPSAFGQGEAPALALSVDLRDRNNPDFRVCMLIRVGNPLQIEWTNGTIKSHISGLLKDPEDDVYPLSFSVEEQTARGPEYSQTTVLNLKLGKPDESNFIASSTFNVVYNQVVLLTTKGCR